MQVFKGFGAMRRGLKDAIRMDSVSSEMVDDGMLTETPEDVAVLYSWANLQGAKYRDFSASRREYRAQMRHRQAEQVREEEMQAKAEAEAAASEAERAAREAEEAARFHGKEARKASQEHHVEDYRTEQEAQVNAQRQAAELNRLAASERVEAARRAEAVAAAEAVARREEREMAEAQASAARQAARYHDSELRRQSLAGPQPTAYVPGEISDPYMAEPLILPGRLFHQPDAHMDDMQPTRHAPSREARLLIPQPDPLEKDHHHVKEYWVTGTMQEEAAIAAGGARAIEEAAQKPKGHVSYYYDPNPQERVEAVDRYAHTAPYADHTPARVPAERKAADPYADRTVDVEGRVDSKRVEAVEQERPSRRAGVFEQRPSASSIYGLSGVVRSHESAAKKESARDAIRPVGAGEGAPMYDPIPGSPRPESASVRRAHRSGVVEAATALHTAASAVRDSSRPRRSRGYRPDEASGVHSSYGGAEAEEPAGSVPAWISAPRIVAAAPRVQAVEERPGEEDYRAQRGEAAVEAEKVGPREAAREILSSYSGQRRTEAQPAELRSPEVRSPEVRPQETLRVAEPREEHRSSVVRRASVPQGSPVMDTLQHSRERVAARWYALKGVFDHHGQEQDQAPRPAAQQVKTVPMLSVFSLAGGTGKTSLVATLGRALSACGEKVLLTDTTSHGLLPFYFGASELKPGVVRTFSPPPGSTDAAIALVSYDVAQSGGDAARQDWFRDELLKKSATMQRVVLDISAISPWVVQMMARSGSVVVVPVTPDMNSVISLGPVEKFFAGIVDSEGRAVQPYYLLNQFDASLPLHLDVREVMKQQLGDRLLPFVIRRSQVVSEALAEGMTVIDYAPDSSAAGDYLNLSQWLRQQSAPALSGNKNARWSER